MVGVIVTYLYPIINRVCFKETISMKNNALNFKIKTHFYDVHINKKQFINKEDISKRWVMFIIEEGSFYYKVDNESGIANTGDIVFCPPNTLFQREVISPLLMHYCSFTWTPLSTMDTNKIIESIFPKYIITFKREKELLKIYASLRYIHSKLSSNKMIWISHLLNDVWFQYCVKEPLHLKKETVQTNDPLMKRVKLYLEEKAFSQVMIQDVAKSFYMHPGQLSTKFKEVYNMTPIEYVQRLRLDKIKLLLIQTDYTIQKIATLCGYENGFYLSRVFKKHMRISPSEYRKSHII